MDPEAPSSSPLEVADTTGKTGGRSIGRACFIGVWACFGLVTLVVLLAPPSCSTGWFCVGRNIDVAPAAASAATAGNVRARSGSDTLLDEQLCQHYYTLDGDCAPLRASIRAEVRRGTPTLELGDPATQPAMLFLHGWPDTAALWANQFERFCGPDKEFFCVAPSWIDFHPDFPRSDEAQPTWSEQVEAFHGVIEELGLQKVTAVIFDFGAALGYQLTYLYPELIERVVALDIGMTRTAPTRPVEGMISQLAVYQQNNINAFLSDDDAAMAENLRTEIGGSSPCDTCRIAPNATGVGARTGWPYWNMVRTDPGHAWTDFFPTPPLDEWEFSWAPSFPAGVPLLFLYSSTRFFDDSWLTWIEGRGDGVSQQGQVLDTDHWLMVRQPAETNRIMAAWLAGDEDAAALAAPSWLMLLALAAGLRLPRSM